MTRQLTESDAGPQMAPRRRAREPLDAASDRGADRPRSRAAPPTRSAAGSSTRSTTSSRCCARIDEIRRDDLYAPRLRRLPGPVVRPRKVALADRPSLGRRPLDSEGRVVPAHARAAASGT